MTTPDPPKSVHLEPASTTQSGVLGTATFTIRWVRREDVDTVLDASDAFQGLLACDIAAGSTAVAAILALAGGELHPLPVLIFLAVSSTAFVLLAGFTGREWSRRKRARSAVDRATVSVPVSYNLVAPGATPTASASGLD